MGARVYHNMLILSMLPDLVGEVGWARQPEALPWANTFAAVWQGSLIWEVLERKGLGGDLQLLATPFHQKLRSRHESELRPIPLKLIIIPSQHLFLRQASASSEEIIIYINGSQSTLSSNGHDSGVFHIGTACGHSVKIQHSYCQHLSCGSATRRKLQIPADFFGNGEGSAVVITSPGSFPVLNYSIYAIIIFSTPC